MTDFIFAEIFRFQNPWGLLLLLPLLLLEGWRWRRKRSAILFSSVSFFRQIPPTWRIRFLPIVRSLVGGGLFLAILALARPQMGREDYRVRSEGIAMAICLDRSGSMKAMDFVLDGQRVDRFAAVKRIFHDFVLGNKDFSGRPDDRISLVAFGGYVDSLCPLTLDHETLAEMLKMIQTPEPLVDQSGRYIRNEVLEEESATAIGDALMTGIERLRESGAKSNVIILLSDGRQNTGAVTAEEAAQAAKTYGIRVYTIGIGSTGLAPFPVYGPGGQKGYSNEPVELDEKTLQTIAETTGGHYFNAKDSGTLQRVCQEIDALEKTVHEDRVFTHYRELYRFFLIPAAVFILLGTVLTKTRFKSLPE